MKNKILQPLNDISAQLTLIFLSVKEENEPLEEMLAKSAASSLSEKLQVYMFLVNKLIALNWY